MKTTEKTRIKREMTGLYESYILEEKSAALMDILTYVVTLEKKV